MGNQQFNDIKYGTLSSLFFIDEHIGWACGSGLDRDWGE